MKSTDGRAIVCPAMSSHRRRALPSLLGCWLLVLCTAAVACALPVLSADVGAGRAARIAPPPAGDPALPAMPGGSSAAIDDLSGPAATAIFHLTSPATRHQAIASPPTPASVYRAHARTGERGPPGVA
jgi:hypothetical protein